MDTATPKPRTRKPDTTRIDVAATIIAGIAANGAGRVRETEMVESALRLADLLIERAK